MAQCGSSYLNVAHCDILPFSVAYCGSVLLNLTLCGSFSFVMIQYCSTLVILDHIDIKVGHYGSV